MSHSLITLSLCLSLVVNAPAPEKYTTPKGLPPTLLMVSAVDPDKGTLTVTWSEQVPVTTMQKVKVVSNEGGKVVEKAIIVPVVTVVNVMKQRSYNLNDATSSVTDTRGKTLKKDEVLKLLRPGHFIAVSENPGGPDPAYRAKFTPDVIILTVSGEILGPPIQATPTPKPKE